MTSLFNYSQLLSASKSQLPQGIAEGGKNRYSLLTERHLQAIWLEQKYFTQLKTKEGYPITVISPGIWNTQAGPDFLKAHLLIDGKELRGDVELHIYDEGWTQHKHHLDSRYNEVVLHIGFWLPKNSERFLLTSEGRAIYSTHFENSLSISLERLTKLIDLDLYPYVHFVGSGKCSETLFNRFTEKETSTLFSSAAVWRLQEKAISLEEWTLFHPTPFPVGFAMALGYKFNSESFASLYLEAKQRRFDSEVKTFAYLLGRSGFFDSHFEKWSACTYYESLRKIFLEIQEGEVKSNEIIKLKLDRIRPANHPIRRLAIMAKVVHDEKIDQYFYQILNRWKNEWPKLILKNFRKFYLKWVDLLPEYHDNYWEYHYTFSQKQLKLPIKLCGSDFKREVLANVVFPLILKTITEPSEIEVFIRFYSSLSAIATKKTAYLVHRFLGNSSKKDLLDTLLMQQGAYQLHKDFCIHYEASCHGCPFVDRYQKLECLQRSELVE